MEPGFPGSFFAEILLIFEGKRLCTYAIIASTAHFASVTMIIGL